MSAILSMESVQISIKGAIQASIDRAKEEIIADAVKGFEEEIRRVVGNVAIDAANYFSVERMGTDLVIRVRIEGTR